MDLGGVAGRLRARQRARLSPRQSRSRAELRAGGDSARSSSAASFDGHELPDDIHAMTKTSAAALAGLGLMGVAKDTYPRDGDTYSFVVGFAEVEVDVETGKVTLVDYLSASATSARSSTRAA